MGAAEQAGAAGARNGAATAGPTGPPNVKGGAASGAAVSAVAEIPDLPAGLPDGPKWLDENRAAAWMAVHQQPMPDRAAHLWRYSDPAAFLLPAAAGGPESDPGQRRTGGKRGATVLPLAAAVRELPEVVREHLGRLIPAGSGKPEDLNAALWSAGTFIRIPKGVALAEPIRLLATVSGGGAFRAIRNLIVIEAGASATIVEESCGAGPVGRDSLNEVTELFAGPDSQVRYMPLPRLGREVTAHRTLRARLESQAQLLTVIAYAGCGLYKADLGVSLDGEGSESKMVGLCLGDGKNRSDHHTVQDHTARHTNSDIDFRVVLGGKARSAYTGSDPDRAGRSVLRGLPGEPEPAALRELPRGVDPRARDPDRRGALQARRDGRTDRSGAALLPGVARPSAVRGDADGCCGVPGGRAGSASGCGCRFAPRRDHGADHGALGRNDDGRIHQGGPGRRDPSGTVPDLRGQRNEDRRLQCGWDLLYDRGCLHARREPVRQRGSRRSHDRMPAPRGALRRANRGGLENARRRAGQDVRDAGRGADVFVAIED